MRKEWIATLDASGEEIPVFLERQNGGYVLRVGDAEIVVDAAVVTENRWSLLIDGRSLVVDVLRDGERTTVVSDGGVSTMIIEDARQKALANAVLAGRGKEQGEVLVAPIAGKVVKLFVEVGAQVEPGQAIVVLEAMKMENEIKASRAGQVSKIHVEPGASVDTRAKLVTIE